MKYTAGFIGVGNMGGALLSAVSKSVPSDKLSVFDLNETNALKAKNDIGAVITGIDDLAKNSKFIFIGVKPAVVESVLKSVVGCISKDTVIVSMAAGVSLEKLSQYSKTDKIIRIMPNTPCAVGEGVVVYSLADGVTDDEHESFVEIMKGCGLVDNINESLIDAAMAVSGCGPAFVYMFIDAVADGAVKCGLSREKALAYAKQMVLGSAKMSINSKKHPQQLKDDVCSPGGTTIEGVMTLEKGAFRHTVSDAVVSAFNKTSKL